MKPLNLVLTGQKSFGAAVLGAVLKAGTHTVSACVSPPYENERLTFDAEGDADARWDKTRLAALRHGVPWRPSGRGLSSADIPPGTDLIVAAHSHWYVSSRARAATRLGAIGYHPSMLPLHRGRSAVEWAIRMGDRLTGGSVYWLTDGVDCGPVAAQRVVFVRPGDTASTLWRRELFPLGVELTLGVIGDVARGRIVRVPQDHALATWEPLMGAPPLHRVEAPQIGDSSGPSGVTADPAALLSPAVVPARPARPAARPAAPAAPDPGDGPASARAAMYGLELL